MSSLLQEVQKLLKIKTVYLQNSFIELAEDVDMNDLGDTSISVQSFKGVSKIREAGFEDDDQTWWEYHFHFAAGIRLVDDQIEQDEDVTPLVEIKGTFSAKYESPERLTQEQIEAFSEKNVGFNVWPYWREYVQSSCMRLNIEPIEVPLYFC
ncbi:hypothetical protein [Photobacterium leiognathi]|uniref:hypothetical protein n=1 Tax=Photobacterium leiognathi TaxID=553611 RepID=UPI0027337866|nr:hypothetical protein [Photobacterium leiognathi]